MPGLSGSKEAVEAMDWRIDRQSDAALTKRMLSVSDVAAICGVSTRTVYRWMDEDDLPVHHIPGSGARPIRRVDRNDLDEWLRQYSHKFAEEMAAATQTIRLNGRKFIARKGSFRSPNSGLDSSRSPASGVPPRKGTQ